MVVDLLAYITRQSRFESSSSQELFDTSEIAKWTPRWHVAPKINQVYEEYISSQIGSRAPRSHQGGAWRKQLARQVGLKRRWEFYAKEGKSKNGQLRICRFMHCTGGNRSYLRKYVFFKKLFCFVILPDRRFKTDEVALIKVFDRAGLCFINPNAYRLRRFDFWRKECKANENGNEECKARKTAG